MAIPVLINKQSSGALWLLVFLWGGCMSLSSGASGGAPVVYYERAQFIELAFRQGDSPKRAMVSVDQALSEQLHQLLGHAYPGRRIRYWQNQEKTAWIFDEVGKDLPITIGMVVHQGKIDLAKVLVYREERGGEIYQAFFTEQFHHARLDEHHQLTASIDGISGATLSVNAFTRMARLALFLDQYIARR